MQEDPARTRTAPVPNRRCTRTAACPRFHSNASCVAPPFRIRIVAPSHGSLSRCSKACRTPQSHPRKARRIPARRVAPPPASSPTPRDRLQHAAPQRPFMFACPRFLATGSPLPHAARFPLHVRALAISGQQSEFWHESAPFRRRIGPADSADLGFRRGGAPSSGEGARSACQNSVSWPENACFPARRAGGVRRSRRGGRLRSPRGRVEEARAPAAGTRAARPGGAAPPWTREAGQRNPCPRQVAQKA